MGRKTSKAPKNFGTPQMVIALLGAALLFLGSWYVAYSYPLNGVILIIAGMFLVLLLAIAIFGPR